MPNCHITDNNNPQAPYRNSCPSSLQGMWMPHHCHLLNQWVGARKVRRSQEEGSGEWGGGKPWGQQGRREKGTGAPSCSIVQEARKVACNLHATLSELFYPPNDKGFTVSTTGQCDTHALPSFLFPLFPSSHLSSHCWGDPSPLSSVLISIH